MTANKKRMQDVCPVVSNWAARQKKNRIIAASDLLDEHSFEWEAFAELYSSLGQPSVPLRALLIVTILQHAYGFSDREAVDQLNSRLDWKYAARMGINDQAFDHSVLSEFRKRLLEKGLQDRLFNQILDVAERAGLLKAEKQRTDSTRIVANVRELNRVDRIREAFRAALNEALDEHAPAFASECDPHWLANYDRKPYGFKLPKAAKERDKIIHQLGLDVSAFLKWSKQFSLSESEVLEEIFKQQMILVGGKWRLKDDDESETNGERIATPHDPDARFGRKGEEGWLGYRTHFTETFTPSAPRLITNVLTVQAHVDDSETLAEIHEQLMKRRVAPLEHLVDAGYSNIEAIDWSEGMLGIRVIAPIKPDTGWQARENKGFAQDNFKIDFQRKVATCPAGARNTSWSVRKEDKAISIRFKASVCKACPFSEDCTKGTQGRTLYVKEESLFRRLKQKREEQSHKEFAELYKARSGVEGTHSQAVRGAGFRVTPYAGLAKTALKAICVGAGLNLMRAASWLLGDKPAQTRLSLQKKLAAA